MNIDKSFLIKYEELMQIDVEEALEFCKEKLEETSNPELLVYIGECYMSLNDFEGAVAMFDEAINTGCQNLILAKSLKGEALFYLDNFKESKLIFTELLKENPNSFFAVAYLTDIDINLGNYEEGVNRAELVLLSNTLDSNDAAYIRTNLGWIKLKYLNKVEEAYNDFIEAIELDENLGVPYIGKGEYYLLKSEYKNAIKNFETAIELGENIINVYLGIALGYKGLGNMEDAFEYFKIVHDADPENEIARKEIEKIINIGK